jgi:hypothetical protein
MPNRLVHEVHALIAFGRPYGDVHRKKDAFSQRAPGIKHRKVKHRKYQSFGTSWHLGNSFSSRERQYIERIARWKSPEIAEQFMVSMSHDVEDKIWDFDGISRDQRSAVREYWEAFCAWLVLNPKILKAWAGVDVVAGRIQREVDGVELWEDEPALVGEYAALYKRVCFLLARNKRLRETVEQYGCLDEDEEPKLY